MYYKPAARARSLLTLTCIRVREKDQLAVRVPLQRARIPHVARARRLTTPGPCAVLAAAPVLVAHAFGPCKTGMKNTYWIRGTKLQVSIHILVHTYLHTDIHSTYIHMYTQT
jgi:hypothetical protein